MLGVDRPIASWVASFLTVSAVMGTLWACSLGQGAPSARPQELPRAEEPQRHHKPKPQPAGAGAGAGESDAQRLQRKVDELSTSLEELHKAVKSIPSDSVEPESSR